MHRSSQEKIDRETRELQRLVYGNAAPGQSAAQKIYPNLRTDTEWRTATIPRRGRQQTAKPTVASVLYPNLPRDR